MQHQTKAKIIEDINGLSIHIASSSSILLWFSRFLPIPILFFLGFDEFFRDYLSKIEWNDPVQWLIICLMIVAIADLLRALLWMLWGQEIIQINSTHISVKNAIFGLGITQKIPIVNVVKVSLNLNPTRKKAGKILIHNRGKILNCAVAVESTEALYLIERIK